MNSNFEFRDAELQGVKLITPFYMEDSRGYFIKSIERDIFKSAGIDLDIFEEFESYSIKNVIRGLHFQIRDPQTKIVRAISGEIVDVLVDLRKDSGTFGKSMKILLSGENHISVLVPAGFAHGFCVISEDATVSYKCIGRYLHDFDTGIIWNDKELNIGWEVKDPVVSLRDSRHMTFEQFRNQYGGL